MCQFFSAIVTRQGDVRFCEDTSHEMILARLGLDDTRPLATRGWVRVECAPPHDAVRVDETSEPGWYAEDRLRFEDAVMAVALRVAPLLATYEAGRAPLWATCEAGCASLWATYEAGCAPLLATYEAGRASLLATCEAGCASLWATCEAGRAPLLATYEAGRAPLLATYEATLRTIEGYVPPILDPRD